MMSGLGAHNNSQDAHFSLSQINASFILRVYPKIPLGMGGIYGAKAPIPLQAEAMRR